MKWATAAQMKTVDETAIHTFEIPSLTLMERAAEGLAAEVRELLPPEGKVAVLCGSGNNGGDGLACARILRTGGTEVRVFLVGRRESMTPDSRTNALRLAEAGLVLEDFSALTEEDQSWIAAADVVVDAIFGVGLNRRIEKGNYFDAIALINESRGVKIAADIVSGLNADTGKIMGTAVKAVRTVTFTALKRGHTAQFGPAYSGQIKVWDIGIGAEIIRKALGEDTVMELTAQRVKQYLPPRKKDGHKGTFGKVYVLGGSVGFTGAPVLAARGALRMGSGLLFLGVPQEIYPIAAVKCEEAMPYPLPSKEGKVSAEALKEIFRLSDPCDAVLLGCGLGRSHGVDETVWEVLRHTKSPVVLDADGINAMKGHMDILEERKDRVTVITPHEREFCRMGGTLSGEHIAVAKAFAAEHGCILVLKGHRTVVAAPDGRTAINTTGNSGMAVGGSGDVLGGMIASLLGQGAESFEAAALAVWLHGKAGDLAAEEKTEYGMLPSDLVEKIPEGIKILLQ